MSKRGGLWCLLGVALLFLALSSLIEAPAMEHTDGVPPPAAAEYAVLLASAFPAREEPHHFLLPSRVFFGVVLVFLSCGTAMRSAALCRDANGRWIRKKRYVSSVYQVFRQETACG